MELLERKVDLAIRLMNGKTGWMCRAPIIFDGNLHYLTLVSEDDCFGRELPEVVLPKISKKSFKITYLYERILTIKNKKIGHWYTLRIDYMVEDGPIDFSEIIMNDIKRSTILVVGGGERRCQTAEIHLSEGTPLPKGWKIESKPYKSSGLECTKAFTL